MLRYRTPIRQVAATARRLGVRRNPLCRRSDRIEAAVAVAGIAVVLAAAGIGIGVGERVSAQQARQSAYERSTRHVVAAVLVAPAGAGRSSTVPVTARWHTGHGVQTGTITARAGLPAGSRVSIWVDQTGAPTPAPLPLAAGQLNAAAAGLAVPGGAVLLALLGRWLCRYRLDRGRLIDWADEWDRIEPRWTRRHTQ